MRFSAAFGLSIAAHLLLGVGIAVILTEVPSAARPAELDLSSVDLSFAETVEDQAPAVRSPVAPPVTPRPQEAQMPPRPTDEVCPNLPSEVIFPAPKEVLPPVPRLTPSAPPSAPAAPTPAPRQARIDAPPRPTRAIRPEYPERARARGEEGDVTLLLSVTEKGLVSSVSILTSSGSGDLDLAALRAAKAARFLPARLHEAPVPSAARLTLSFKLR